MKTPTITPEEKTEAIADFVVENLQKHEITPGASSITSASLVSEVSALMTMDTDIKRIKGIAPVMIEGHELISPSNEAWTYYCSVARFISMGWDKEEEPELAKAWEQVWQELNAYSLKNLTGDNLNYYKEKTKME